MLEATAASSRSEAGFSGVESMGLASLVAMLEATVASSTALAGAVAAV
jgi:hypothetical protein